MDIEVKVPNYNLYDTHNIQEELAKNINDIFSDEESFKLHLKERQECPKY